MSQDKKQVLMDSIKKLLSLNIDDEEIIINLRDVGVGEEEARGLLEEAKSTKSRKKDVKPTPEEIERKRKEEEKELSEIKGGKGLLGATLDKLVGGDKKPDEKEEDVFEDITEKPAPVIRGKPAKTEIPHTPNVENKWGNLKNPKKVPEIKTNISDLWEKGILAAVDSKLEKMQEIENDLSRHINEVVREEVSKEAKKLQVLLDSQKTLTNSKVDANLEKRGAELKEMVANRMTELSTIHEELQSATTSFKAARADNDERVRRLNEKMAEMEKTKSRLVSEMNSALIESQSKSQEYLDEAKRKVTDIDARINRTLQLESKITEGLIEDAKAKVDKLALKKNDELDKQIKEKIAELDAMAGKVDPEKIQGKINELDAWKDKMGEKQEASLAEMFEMQRGTYKKRLEEQLAENEKSLQKSIAHHGRKLNDLVKENDAMLKERELAFGKQLGAIEKRFTDLDKKLKQSLNFSRKELEELDKVVNVDRVKSAMQEMDLFKEQFVKVIERNVAEFNMAKRSMTEQMQSRDRAITEHIKKINAKMAELTAFEKKFAEEMGMLIEKSPEPKDEKKGEEKKGKKK
ncbi:MAG: hypothetical protein ABID38_01995 [Candidatus Diapherotrites archaeon]